MTNTQLLVIAGSTVKTDEEGRYCLNDLHKAAGGAAKHQPAHFFETVGKELVNELTLENPRIKPVQAKAGRYGGTYVVRELVYAYAMWISPKLHLEVIRGYDHFFFFGVL